MAEKGNNGQFSKGHTGRPKGAVSGRTQVLNTIDGLLKKAKNKKIARDALQLDFEKNPVKFIKSIVLPLIPKQAQLDVNVLDQIDIAMFRDIMINNYEQLSDESSVIAAEVDKTNGDTDTISEGLET